MDIEPILAKAAPGVAGSLIAMWRLQGITMWQRIWSFLGGCASSYYLPPLVHDLFPGSSENVIAFVIGLFSMAVIAKIFETIDELKPIKLLNEALKKRGWI